MLWSTKLTYKWCYNMSPTCAFIALPWTHAGLTMSSSYLHLLPSWDLDFHAYSQKNKRVLNSAIISEATRGRWVFPVWQCVWGRFIFVIFDNGTKPCCIWLNCSLLLLFLLYPCSPPRVISLMLIFYEIFIYFS